MPLKGVHCTLGYVSLDDHKKCMVTNPGPPCGIEPSILEMMTRPNAEREGVVFSPSSLSSCHRQSVLVGKHDWYLDVQSGYKRIRGTIVHQGMGLEPPYPGVLGVVRELRMRAPINTKYGEQVFHGMPDLVVLLGVRGEPVYTGTPNTPDNSNLKIKTVLRVKIVDYKTKDEVSHELTSPDRSHVYQVNMYAWLVQKFLPGWLKGYADCSLGPNECDEHIKLNEGVELPHIDEVVVDELSIQYMDMRRTRSFTSKGFLYDKGKMLSDYRNGRWVRRKPPEHEELELEPIHQFSTQYVESIIRKGIEDQIEAEKDLAPPLTGDSARIMCTNCPVRQVCYDTGRQEGYDMLDQLPYINPHAGSKFDG